MEQIDLAQVLREIYDSELSFSIAAPVWDAGIVVKIGDHENSVKAERTFRPEELDLIPRWLADIREAIAQGDASRLRHAAHTLKGAVGNFRARGAFDEAQRLETMGRDGNLASAAGACATLEKQLDRLLPALAALSESV